MSMSYPRGYSGSIIARLDFRDKLFQTGLFHFGSTILPLIGTKYYIFLHQYEFGWYRKFGIEPYKEQHNFEEVLEDIPEEVAAKLLFHMDLFMERKHGL